jgi:hypothetical protein
MNGRERKIQRLLANIYTLLFCFIIFYFAEEKITSFGGIMY